MKLWRPIVVVHVPGAQTEKYYAPWATLFPSFKSQFSKLQTFVNECKFMYILNVLTPNRTDYKLLEEMENNIVVETKYKRIDFHPLKDTFNRIITLFKYGF